MKKLKFIKQLSRKDMLAITGGYDDGDDGGTEESGCDCTTESGKQCCTNKSTASKSCKCRTSGANAGKCMCVSIV